MNFHDVNESLDAWRVFLTLLSSMDRLEEADAYLEKLDSNSHSHYFYRGLYFREKNDKISALRCFHEAKSNDAFHDEAIFEMVELLLHLDDIRKFCYGSTTISERQQCQLMTKGLLDQVCLPCFSSLFLILFLDQ